MFFFILVILFFLTSPIIVAQELLEITPNTSRCDLLKALNGNENLPNDCQPCPSGQCKGSFHSIEPPKRAVLSNVRFANNSDELTDIAKETLYNIAQAMKQTPEEKYHIQGHTNYTGTYALNMRLSEQRARAVSNFLIQSGVSEPRLIVEGFGYNKPYSNDPKEGINRRVEFVNHKEISQ